MTETPKKEKNLVRKKLSFSELSPPKFKSRSYSLSDETEIHYSLLPQTPCNSSDGSENNSLTGSYTSLLASSEEIANGLAVNGLTITEIEENTKKAYPIFLNGFKVALQKICRQLRMLNSIYVQDCNDSDRAAIAIENEEYYGRRLKQLIAMEKIIERKTAYVEPYFSFLFDLHSFLDTCSMHFIIQDQKLNDKICDLIKIWLESPAFHHQNYEKLLFFLYNFYNGSRFLCQHAPGRSILSDIRDFWESSFYFEPRTYSELISKKQDYIGAFYSSVLLKKLEENLDAVANAMSSIIGLAINDLKFFHDFLNKYEIPFSGPYRNNNSNDRRILYFLSSPNPSDSVINNGAPMYGAYTFRLSSLSHLDTDTALKIWENLEIIPFWLHHIPPLFNLSLENIREKMFSIKI